MAETDQTYQVAVARAAQLVGGAEALSRVLRVPVAEVMRWARGEGKPPIGIFLRIVDVLIEEGRKSRFHGEAPDPGEPPFTGG